MAVHEGPGAGAAGRLAGPRGAGARARRSSSRRAAGAAEDEVRLREAELTLGRRAAARQGAGRQQGGARLGAGRCRLAEGAHRAGAAAGQGRRDVRSTQRQTDLDRHGRPRAVRRRRDLEGRAAGRDDLAGVGRRRLHAHRHLHDRRHDVARDRSRRQRELHQPRARRARTVDAVLDAYPDWQIPGARDHARCRRPIGRRRRCSVRIGFEQLDPRILPDMGVKVTFLTRADRPPTRGARGRRLLVPKAAVRNDDGQRRSCSCVRDDRVERRAVKARRRRDGDRVEVAVGRQRRRAGGRRRRRRR